MFAEVSPCLREAVLEQLNFFGIGKMDFLNVGFARDQVPFSGLPATGDCLFDVPVVWEQHPRSLPVNRPSSYVLAKQERAQRPFFDFNWFLFAAVLLMPHPELPALSDILQFV